ncbi:MAG TPA: membrane dipeptidase, partial [Flavobacteriales bacterium]|nr:membrane dipeptidase [Flavobacteriales bacterium]
MPLFDLHSHFSFKPANSYSTADVLPDVDHWNERLKRKKEWLGFSAALANEVVKSSQLHGNAATEGGFRVIVNGLYPLEEGFVHPGFIAELATLTGHAFDTLNAILERRISPFAVMEREYRNLLDGSARTGLSAKGNRFVVVRSHAEIIAALRDDPDTICIVNSIEGAHAFGDTLRDEQGNTVSLRSAERRYLWGVGDGPRRRDFMRLVDGMRANIAKVKQWEHPPFFVTFSHHYYNHLAGQSPSLSGIVKVLVSQKGTAPNESDTGVTSYYRLGFRSWGLKVLADLIRRNANTGERRILIDTKHLSPQARSEYYTIVDQARSRGDHIPIIASHTAVNGRKALDRTMANVDAIYSDEKESTQFFHPGAINLFDDEIKRIVASDGIMGLMIDERRIMGRAMPPEAGVSMTAFKAATKANKRLMKEWTLAKQRHAWGEINATVLKQELTRIDAASQVELAKLRPAYLSVLCRQLFHIMALDGVGVNGWYHVALGTDYDGVINPVDIYRQSSDMRTLRD